MTTTSTSPSALPSGAEEATHRRSATRPEKKRIRWGGFGIHAVLLIYTFIALGPMVLVVANSLKSRRAIFDSPFGESAYSCLLAHERSDFASRVIKLRTASLG